MTKAQAQSHDITCWVYKSSRKDEMYLYSNQKDDFTEVPEPLLKQFGTPQFVMELELNAQKKLARVDINQVIDSLNTQGFFLQMPPELDPYMYHGNDL